jgi:hypothetical protein
MNAVQAVTDKQVDQVIDRVEQINQDDANLLRAYIRGLRSMLRALLLQSDDESIGDNE